MTKKIVAIGKKFKPTGEVIENGFLGIYREYEFLPWEIDLLLEGEEVKVLTEKNDIVFGRLEKTVIEGKDSWEYKETIPYKTWGHIWKVDERKKLLNGKTLHINDFYNPKKIRNFGAEVYFDKLKREIILKLDNKDEFNIT